MSLLIKNGEIITPDERYTADIFCEDETITRIERNIDKVKAERVPAIFSEAQVSPNVAQALAKDAGVKTVVTDLVTDSLGDPPADSYLGLMRTDVKKIVDALK